MHIHLDPVGGVAGDMFVAAMLGAAPDLVPRIMADLDAVLPAEAGSPELSKVAVSGMSASAFRLARDSAHRHSRHERQAHGLTSYAAFRRRIESAALSAGTAGRACDILRRIGEAEAEIHGVPLEEVHFHELADWDTLMDVVAAGSIAAALEGATWSVSALPLGGGLVRTAHGRLPVPAPATARILLGYEWRDDGIAGERVTPTGAAIVAHVTAGAGNGAHAGGRLRAIGTGAGTRSLPGLPNVLRATLFEPHRAGVQALTLMAFEIDDMTGEEIATAADRLRATAGVHDVLLLAAQGKKGRPVTRMEVQAAPACADAIADAIFLETSTLGLRRMEVMRDVLDRRDETTPQGLRRKRAFRPRGIETVKLENDELAGMEGLNQRRHARDEAER